LWIKQPDCVGGGRLLPELEARRARLFEWLAAVGDFRRGSISENWRRSASLPAAGALSRAAEGTGRGGCGPARWRGGDHRSAAQAAHAPNGAAVVGVDLGVRDLLVAATPDGQEVARIPAPNPLKRAQRQLQALQRKAARQYGPREPGAPRQSSRREPSHGWQATQAQIRRLHARAANLRADALHQATTALSQQHRVIGVETLAVANMTRRGGARKRGLNRSLNDASLGAVALLLGYKTMWYGSTLIKAARWFPSSKTCSSCGAVKAKLGLHERAYHCERCGLVIDRDLNAAINLARHALAQTMGEIAPGGSGPLDSGGADRKTPTHAGAGGNETATPTGGAASAAGGTAPPQGEAA
jgi:putative transposase